MTTGKHVPTLRSFLNAVNAEIWEDEQQGRPADPGLADTKAQLCSALEISTQALMESMKGNQHSIQQQQQRVAQPFPPSIIPSRQTQQHATAASEAPQPVMTNSNPHPFPASRSGSNSSILPQQQRQPQLMRGAPSTSKSSSSLNLPPVQADTWVLGPAVNVAAPPPRPPCKTGKNAEEGCVFQRGRSIFLRAVPVYKLPPCSLSPLHHHHYS